jgi:hypothetical protein
MRVAEGVDADDGVLAGVLEHLVVHALVLDFPALVAALHRAQHAAALGEGLEFAQDRFLHQFREFVDDKRALERVLVHREAVLAVDDVLNGDGAAHGRFRRGGDGLVERVGVQ